MKIEIDVSDTLFSVLELGAEEHGRTISDETVAVLEDWLGTPKEIREMANDLDSMRDELSQAKEETSDFIDEISRRIKTLFILDK